MSSASLFGHSISKSQLQRLETALAVQQLAKPTTLPSNIVPNVPAVFCWDNKDILEETRTGSHTTHCTNGIVIQRLPDSAMFIHEEIQPSKTTRQRSVHPPTVDVDKFIGGKRVGP